MFLHRRFVPGLAIYSYIIGDTKAGICAVIDPVRDVEEYLQVAKANRLRIEHIVETHVHADYVSGALELKSRLEGKPRIHCSGLGGKEWIPAYADVVTSDGEELRLGNVRLQAVHTPGHSAEHMSWLLFDEPRSKETPYGMFTGDFLFVGSIGRPDLLGDVVKKELAHQLYHSLFSTLADYPDFMRIFPTHGGGSLCGKAIGTQPSSTLGYERRLNLAFEKLPEERWIASVFGQMPSAPPYFRRMKHLNTKGAEILGLDCPGCQALSIDEALELIKEETVILDVRGREAFATAHIPGAIHVPPSLDLSTWAGWIVPYDRPILLVLGCPSQHNEVVKKLIRIGLDQIAGYLEGGVQEWTNQGLEFSHIAPLSVQELAERKEEFYLVDVRTEHEWLRGYVAGAQHIELETLAEKIQSIPKDKPVAFICGRGNRSSIAASLAKRGGIQQVVNILGGMSAWHAFGLPVETNGQLVQRTPTEVSLSD